MTRRVLMYRLGSLGDTIVALPSFHLVRRSFPEAERRVLTNFPTNKLAPTMEAVLGESGLANGYFQYPLGTRSPLKLLRLIAQIRSWGPDLAVYMAAPRGRRAAWRDVAFLRACGAKKIVGVPTTAEQQSYRFDAELNLWEPESVRLGRCLRELGDIEISNAASWHLEFTEDEEREGRAAIAPMAGMPFLVASPGSKSQVQDWGEDNWQVLLEEVSCPDLGLVLVGAQDEYQRCARLANGWKGPSVVLCGQKTLRVTAAAMQHALLFVGHDSGPMHLAAAVGLPSISIFSSHDLRGIWFPQGKNHKVFYTDIQCAGCGLLTCETNGKACIRAIRPSVVVASVVDCLTKMSVSRSNSADFETVAMVPR